MSAGDAWLLPGGHKAIEVEGSTHDTLRVMVIPPGWHWPKPVQEVARVLCERLPMKYFSGKNLAAPDTAQRSNDE